MRDEIRRFVVGMALVPAALFLASAPAQAQYMGGGCDQWCTGEECWWDSGEEGDFCMQVYHGEQGSCEIHYVEECYETLALSTITVCEARRVDRITSLFGVPLAPVTRSAVVDLLDLGKSKGKAKVTLAALIVRNG